MQAYSAKFARAYDMRWRGFAEWVAPLIREFYAGTPIGQTNENVLDLCCGTGQLAAHFLEAGFRVVGLDLSEHMLCYAREKAGDHLASGRASFVQGDARDFALDEQFGLVVSTYDALNHLDDEQDLESCFRCVSAALVDGGLFIFDLNTALGLRRWNGINVNDNSDDLLLITRGIFDGGSKAWVKITGFVRVEGELYERFDETVFNTLFEPGYVREALIEAGLRDIHIARVQDLGSPLAEPEEEARVFFVAAR
jgi:SAM-dependent methyltransferase